MSQVWMFPGQGAQKVGMAADLIPSSDLAKQANDLCGFDLLKAMTESPAELLNSTSYTQPALFLHSALVIEAAKASGKIAETPDLALGLSLGEYSALYAVGALSFESAMKALVVRGRAMQKACEAKGGTMLTVLGLDDEVVESICAENANGQVLQPANFNMPGQVVVSGEEAAIERVTPIFQEKGARRVMPLKVAGAFHSPLMAPAAEELDACLKEIEINEGAAKKVIANVTALPHEPGSVRKRLVEQVTGSVRFTQSVRLAGESMQGASWFELGTGKVLAGLVKRSLNDTIVESIETAENTKN